MLTNDSLFFFLLFSRYLPTSKMKAVQRLPLKVSPENMEISIKLKPLINSVCEDESGFDKGIKRAENSQVCCCHGICCLKFEFSYFPGLIPAYVYQRLRFQALLFIHRPALVKKVLKAMQVNDEDTEVSSDLLRVNDNHVFYR